jgi:putative ABC transport system permease protein
MISNYLRISFRHLVRHKMYTLINVFGLAVAITCILLAVLYLRDERSYDRFHANKANLYRVLTSYTDEKGQRSTVAGTGQPQGPAFKEAVPEVLDYTRVWGGDIRGDIIANKKSLNVQILFADPQFFEMFSFPLLHGNAQSALIDLTSVVITESVARKFFNRTDVLGERIELDADPSAQKLGKASVITGVVKDLPANSSIRFDIVQPMRYIQFSFTDTTWLNQYLGTFVSLHPGANLQEVARKFDRVFATHAMHQVQQNRNQFNYDPKISYGLQRITDMHLHPYLTGASREGGIVNQSDPVFSWIFMGIAVFILFMATVNFINISIAGSLKRAKEVGVRKINGGSKRQIIAQFMTESAIVCMVAFLWSVVFTIISLPVFNGLVKKEILLSVAMDAGLFAWLCVILVAIILLSSVYPAYVLSAFEPKEVLYNKQKLSGKNVFGRSLVVLQFSLAVFFIITTIVYYQQMDFVRTKNLGYEPNQVVRTNIRGNREYKTVQSILVNELEKEPAIRFISFGADGQLYDIRIGDRQLSAMHEVIDEYRLPAMQVKLKAGRNISSAIPSDYKHAILVNETFVKAAGLESPIGTQLYINDRFDKELKTIVGVVTDFHSGSLREPIRPMVMFACDWASGGIWISIEKRNTEKTLRAIAAAYQKAMPTAVYEYQFLDDLNAQAYEQEKRWQKIVSIAAGLSIVICCLGLFGLAHLAAQRRIKEIGIRKVLGATAIRIAGLLSMEFLKLVILSLFIAIPLAGWVMNNWLEDFAYRIPLSWWMFLMAAALAIVIAALTISYQAIRAALANPVKNLRTE